ncbi:MAG: Ppx/GppA family phosphatase [Elusimicrobia bacterium]|nr:Ppx/GppA family phosphatase [Elusimicrobiota bacterium]
MRLALIDLGTNAVRFDVVAISMDGAVRRLHRERLAVRLGEGVFQTGRLSPAAMARTLAAFQSFRKTCRTLRVERVTAFGTSALRDSANSQIFLEGLKRKTGFEIRVISGREEARLIAQGILPHEKKNAKGVIALVDIGGGSVEITLCRGRKILRSHSFKLGAARLQQVFLKTVPPVSTGGEDSPVKKLRRHARSLLADGAPRGGWPKVTRIIGSAGTIRALDGIHRTAGGDNLTAKNLRRWADKFSLLSRKQLARVPGMDPKRIDTLLAGAVVLEEVSRALNAGRVEPTDFSLRDGMLEEERAVVRRGAGTAMEFHLKDVFERACRWGLAPRYLRHVEGFARVLFDQLGPLHRLGGAWRDYLVAAAWLQDVGEGVNPVHHERHSYYMIKNGDFPGLEDWALEFIGQLVLWHKGGKVVRKDIPFKDSTRRGAFFRLLALLRIVDALEKPQSHLVTLCAVRRERGRVGLDLAGERSSVDLAVLRVEQKKELFEKVFHRSLSARSPL